MKKICASFKIFLLLVMSVIVGGTSAFILLFVKGRASYYMPQLWHKLACLIVGLKIEVVGKPDHSRQMIYVSNHISYLDIPAVGSQVRASFIAKEEIEGWPGVGLLGKAQQTAYISRTSANAGKVANALDVMLKDGKSLILFPEGTSSVGTSVLPFKSSLFALAMPKNMPPISLQPFIIELIDADGKPLTPESRDYYAWYADMEFAPHIWIFLQTTGATVRLTFLDVITPQEGQSRKELCKIIEAQITSGLNPA